MAIGRLLRGRHSENLPIVNGRDYYKYVRLANGGSAKICPEAEQDAGRRFVRSESASYGCSISVQEGNHA